MMINFYREGPQQQFFATAHANLSHVNPKPAVINFIQSLWCMTHSLSLIG